MFVVGLTGGIACGKSSVADCFAALGIPIIDTDIIARELVRPGAIALNEIIQEFGKEFLNNDGELNRAALAQHCFAKKHRRQKLEAILHPKIRHIMQQQLEQQKSQYAIAVIPLLVESDPNPIINRILVVNCPPEQQLQRLKKRDNRSKEQIDAILKAQASPQQRLEAADDVIDNTAAIDQLKPTVNKLHQQYIKMAKKTE